MKRRLHLNSIIGLITVLSLPIAGSWARHMDADCCAMDGGTLDELSQVRLVVENGPGSICCCIRCAELWRARHGAEALQILVRDEIHGRELPAQQAHFVRSSVVTNRMAGSRIHVFADETDALKHAREFHGKLLTGDQRPLQPQRVEVAND